MFNDCIYLCDIDEKLSITKKPAINLLPERQYRLKLKLRIHLNKFWRDFRRRNVGKNRLNEVITQLGKPFNPYRRESYRTLLQATRQQV